MRYFRARPNRDLLTFLPNFLRFAQLPAILGGSRVYLGEREEFQWQSGVIVKLIT